jgi:DnaJ-class molecular chaperone
MSARPQNQIKHKDIHVEFGKRFTAHNNRPAPVLQQTCERCCGTGRIRERGNRIICKPCAGTGRITVIKDRAS